jgi:hypothetical protein
MEEETTGGQNRLFMILAVSLVGLLVLGLVGIGGVFIIRQNLEQQNLAAKPSPTVLLVLPNATATFTPAPPKAATPVAPTPTNTPVVAKGSGGEEAAAAKGAAQGSPTPPVSATRTPAPGAAKAGATEVVPETGLGGLEIVLLAVGLTAVLLVARKLRMAA